MRIPITFPFHDPPAQEKRYKEERERREMRFGDRVGGQLLEKASYAERVLQSENQSCPNLTPVFSVSLYGIMYMTS